MNHPLVSILIITFNQLDFIHDTLNSALTQDYPNLEVIVADDGSTDGTAEKILEYTEKYPDKLVALVKNKNQGITANSNRGLDACKGKYIAFQGGDDILLPGKISAQVKEMQKHPEQVLNYHDVELFESNTGKTLSHWSDSYRYRKGNAETIVLHGTFMPATSVMLDRSRCPALRFDERIKISSDWLFWIESLQVSGGKIGYFDKIYARYRRHPHNITGSNSYKVPEYHCTLDIVEQKYPALVRASRQRRSLVHLVAAKQAIREKHYLFGIKSILKAFSPQYGFGLLGLAITFKRAFSLKL